jgi:hypothetical protein
MTLAQIIEELNLRVLTQPRDLSQVTPTAGYASDMLSRVMACGPREGGLWVTLQAHVNIVAVGAVLGLCAIVVTEGEAPDAETIAKADEMGIAVLATDRPTFWVVGNLWRLGLRDS